MNTTAAPRVMTGMRPKTAGSEFRLTMKPTVAHVRR